MRSLSEVIGRVHWGNSLHRATLGHMGRFKTLHEHLPRGAAPHGVGEGQKRKWQGCLPAPAPPLFPQQVRPIPKHACSSFWSRLLNLCLLQPTFIDGSLVTISSHCVMLLRDLTICFPNWPNQLVHPDLGGSLWQDVYFQRCLEPTSDWQSHQSSHGLLIGSVCKEIIWITSYTQRVRTTGLCTKEEWTIFI